jgi:hypothetical protein
VSCSLSTQMRISVAALDLGRRHCPPAQHCLSRFAPLSDPGVGVGGGEIGQRPGQQVGRQLQGNPEPEQL